MAEAENNVAETINGDCHDFKSLLSSSDRDFLVRNNGDQVKIDSLKGKKLGLYFSASWCGPCRRFTPKLVEVYSELSPKGDFEIIFISGDEDEESFDGYFSKMPWLAIPFSDSETREGLDKLFKVMGIPHLVLLDENGKVSTDDGVGIIREYGEEGYPFTPEKIQELKDLEEKARTEQSIKTILVSRSRDFVVTSDGNKVPVSELEGKTVGLYFAVSTFKPSADFTAKLAEVYKKLKEKGENFEIVVISLDDEEESFKESFVAPWLAVPFKDKSCEKLTRYFELSTLPTIVIIGPDGKTLHSNVAEAIEEHGIQAYPFTPEKFAELAEIEKAREAAQTLESVLISGDLDFVIGKDGAKVQVTDLVGRTVLLYFSAHWCPPCRAFTPKLVEAYNKIKAKDEAFEVVFISSDKDQASFEEYYSEMPWLALPFGDARKPLLSRKFKVQGIPMLITIGPTGKAVTNETRNLIMDHGADAYPFTEERLKEIEAKYEETAKEMAKEWPEKLKHELHEEHELVLTRRRSYYCDKCNERGQIWSFYCEECDFDLHPKCALEKDKETKADEKEEESPKEGWVCDGEVCKRA
ncbi:probable nucleoredoxin 1 [Durio zibethinus]|uniref:protein-disulfide reductase n=1 Tax=Durio zibethinus TaxID=66656 RepID=A0A6P5Y618_DURZI|nr:probable nucleoredoxin 1 [Durio zibethinus]